MVGIGRVVVVTQVTRRIEHTCTTYTTTLISNNISLSTVSTLNLGIRVPIFAIDRTTRVTNIRPRALHRCSHLNLIIPRHARNNTQHCALHSITHLTRTRRLDRSRNVGLTNIARVLSLRRRGERLHQRVQRLHHQLSNSDIFRTNVSNRIIRIQRSPFCRIHQHKHTCVTPLRVASNHR